MSRWSNSRTAVNIGYGMSDLMTRLTGNPKTNLPRPPNIPDLIYNYRKTKRPPVARGGKALVKGSAEAKRRMAYLRSLRGRGSYTSAALEGGADWSFLTELAEALGAQAFETLKAIATHYQESLMNLIKDPNRLINLVNEHAPKIAKKLIKFFKKRFAKPKKPLTVTSDEAREEIANFVKDRFAPFDKLNDIQNYLRNKKPASKTPEKTPEIPSYYYSPAPVFV